MPNLSGISLGRYQLLEPLGEGGMAIVYKAYDTRLECDVAVKVIRTEKLPRESEERARKRFEREAKSVAKLTHANIVRVMDYGEYEGNPYLVMPYLPGGTLKELIKQRGQLPWQQAAQLLIPIAEALGYAHSQGIIHRDIKPSNILLTTSGTPMLTDFGVAKIIDEEATQDLTGTSATVGTPEYMAPEQVASKTVDARVDLYAFGVVFYEMVTGRRPFEADTPLAILVMHARDPLPRPAQFVKDLPDTVEKFLIKALAKKPDDRYQTAEEMVAALKGLSLEKVGVLPPTPPGPVQAKQKVEIRSTPSQNKKPLWIGLTLIGMIVLVGGGFLLAKLTDRPVNPPASAEVTSTATKFIPTITSTITSTSTPEPSPTVTATPLLSLTSTPVGIKGTLTKTVFCRQGPNDLIYSYSGEIPQQEILIIGKNEEASWYYFQVDGGDLCWTKSNSITILGNINEVLIKVAPQTTSPIYFGLYIAYCPYDINASSYYGWQPYYNPERKICPVVPSCSMFFGEQGILYGDQSSLLVELWSRPKGRNLYEIWDSFQFTEASGFTKRSDYSVSCPVIGELNSDGKFIGYRLLQ